VKFDVIKKKKKKKIFCIDLGPLHGNSIP